MDLSVIIPSRNEPFLAQTVADVLANMRVDSEIIVVLDGAWPVESFPDHERVTVLYQPVARGQRGAVNDGMTIARGRYVMKLDAHCGLSEGFDRVLIESGDQLGSDVTQVPEQYNFHVFDRICRACGHKMDMGPSTVPCQKCLVTAGFDREIVWRRRMSRVSRAWCFDADLHFQYFGDYTLRPEGQGEIHPTMSCLGACWVMQRDRYWQLEGLDERHGGWGQMGTEIACKSWLSGGQMLTNRRAWFAHMFRMQGGDFGFPFPLTQEQVHAARAYSQQVWYHNAWPKQIRTLLTLVDQFWPVKGWTEEQRNALSVRPPPVSTPPTVGLVYYSDCRPSQALLDVCMRQITAGVNGHKIVSVTLAPVNFGMNIVLPLARSPLTMFRQILVGLEALDTEYVFMAEHDVLYHPSHFAFVPPRRDTYFYNLNVWKVDVETGRAVHYQTKQTSGLCADRMLLIRHYRERIRRCEAEGFSRAMGFEPGSHGRKERIDDVPSETWWSSTPNIDLRHKHTLTKSRWATVEFRDQRNCKGWTEADVIPGWGSTRDLAAYIRIGQLTALT